MKMGTLDFSGFDVTVTLIIKLRLFGCFGDFAKKTFMFRWSFWNLCGAFRSSAAIP